MGFLDHSTNNIIVDAVLTEKGRKLLAENQLNIQGYTFGDDEVDYSLVLKYGDVVGKEKIQKNTPIFEASTSADNPVQHFLYTDTDLSDGVQTFEATPSLEGDGSLLLTVTTATTSPSGLAGSGYNGDFLVTWNPEHFDVEDAINGTKTIQGVSPTLSMTVRTDTDWVSSTIRVTDQITLQTRFVSYTR